MPFLPLLCLLLSAFDGSYNISTVAGSSYVGENVPATSAILMQADGIATDAGGNVYISDAANHRIRSVAPNGLIRTIAGNGVAGFAGDGGPASASQLNSPYGLAFDSSGNLFIADLGNARIRCIAPSGIISTVAGGGALPAGGNNDGSPATVLSFNAPRNIAMGPSGVMYISDFGAQRIYQMASGGTVTTFAGTGVQGYSGDGVAAIQELSFPAALAVDRAGSVYIADSGNHLVRKVSAGVMTSIARSSLPTGLAYDGFSTLYVADHSAAQILVIPLSSGTPSAMNVSATDVAYGVDGNLYVADVTVARRVSLSGAATVIAGGGSLAAGDGGPATQALLNQPNGVALDTAGNLYIADRANNRIRRVGLNGAIATVAGVGTTGNTGDGGAATLAALNAPNSVAFDAFDNLYIADTGNARIRMVTPAGIILPVPTVPLSAPAYMTFDHLQYLYIADSTAIYKITPSASYALASGLHSPRGMAFDAGGNFYFSETGAKRVSMLTPSGNLSSIASGSWSAPQGIAIDASGNLLVADSGLAQIVSVDSFGEVIPIAGTGSAGFAGDGGSSLLAELNAPTDVALNASGVYIADSANNRIRQLTATGSLVTVSPLMVVSAVNAASLAPGPIAPGMLLDLLGVPDVTQVSFNSIPAPILATNPVLVRVPVSVTGTVQITINDQTAPITANVVAAAPALFTNAPGQASVLNQDGTLNSPSNPAAPGSLVSLFGTGEGVTGLPFSVTIAGYPATIAYAGPSGFPGMFQINAQVPAGYLAGGTVPVVVGVGTFTTQEGLMISIF